MDRQRRRASPVERPTEWITAVVMLVTAVIAFTDDRDIAGLIAVGAACLPVIVTAVVTWWESRRTKVPTEPRG